jgi:hypothetical protein
MPQRMARINDRHPFEVYLLVWALVSTAPSALGLAPLSQVIEDSIGPTLGRLWAVGLSLGCAVALTGLAWHRPSPRTLSVTGLIWEQVGLVAVSGATIFYAVAALLRSGLTSLAIVGVILGYGTASAVQAWKLQKLLNALHLQDRPS